MILEKMEEDPMDDKVAKIVEAIQHLQQMIKELELQIMPNSP